MAKYPNKWCVYRANKSNTGFATQFESRVDDKDNLLCFLMTSQQNSELDADGNATFAWKDRTKTIVMKLGEADLGELLALLYGYKNFLGQPKDTQGGGLFHQNDKGNTVLKMWRDKEKGVINMQISQKIGDQLLKANHSISLGEAALFRVILENTVSEYYS